MHPFRHLVAQASQAQGQCHLVPFRQLVAQGQSGTRPGSWWHKAAGGTRPFRHLVAQGQV